MYVERVRELADFIARNHFPFDYESITECIGGHAARYWPNHVALEPESNNFSVKGLAQFLDVSSEVVYELCFTSQIGDYSTITRTMAVKTLRHLADTGKVVFE